MKFFNTMIVFLCFGFIAIGSADAATKFLSGYRDGIWVYGVIERNGIQYRTDQTGGRTNQILWDELSSEDKMKLAKTYSYMTGRLANHFGSEGQDTINTFVNDATGWTALVTALKDKHANKEFPDLAAIFGTGINLDLPAMNVNCWEVRNSKEYRDAVRLREEIKADFEIGREVYTMLVNAKWDQVSISIKALSGPLIKVIVDNFITGFVVHGTSSVVSDLVVAADTFKKDLEAFITQKYLESSAPPSAAVLIAKLDLFLGDMEKTAMTAKDRVNSKKEILTGLAENLLRMDENCIQSRRASAEQARAALEEPIKTLPSPDVPEIKPDPVPADIQEEARAAWIFNNLHDKAVAVWDGILDQVFRLKLKLDTQETNIQDQFNSVFIPGLGEPFDYDYDGMTSGFDGRYRQINELSSVFNAWNLTPNSSACSLAQTIYEKVEQEAKEHIDNALLKINPIQAISLGMDHYAGYLGTRDNDGTIHPLDPLPSIVFKNTGIRNFDGVVNMIATPDQVLSETIGDLGTRKTIIDSAGSNMADGIARRTNWIKDQYPIYENLMFNFENSLSHVIAGLKQIDTLHQDPYFISNDSPYTSYGDLELFTYKINTNYILEKILELGTNHFELQKARQAAIKRLFELHSREQALIQKLTIAQDSHINDVQALTNFYAALASQYRVGWSLEIIFQDVKDITGNLMKGQYDAWNDLVPDITYYYLGEDNWIRKPDKLGTSPFARDLLGNPSPYARITGKTETYYLVYDLYNVMKNEKASLLAKSQEEFNAWMTQTTIAIDTYKNRLQTEGVYAPGWPCWQLLFAVNNLREFINSEYRNYSLPELYYWQVQGHAKTADGIAAAGMDIILDGCYGEDCNDAHIAFPATTGIDGRFVFELVSTGNFTIKASGTAGGFALEPENIAMGTGNVSVTLTAVPTLDFGNYLAGKIENSLGQTIDGVNMVLESIETGEIRSILTLGDGSFSFTGLAIGNYKVYPVEQDMEAVPKSITISVPKSKTDLKFILSDEPVIIPGDMNDDNILNLADVMLVLETLVGENPDMAITLGDINDDELIDLTEAIYLTQ